MTGRHLTSALLNSWVDGELSSEEQRQVDEHLAECPACTSAALSQTLLKSAIAKAGQRYALPPHLLGLIQHDINEQTSVPNSLIPSSAPDSAWKIAVFGWATAAVLLLAAFGSLVIQRNAQRAASVSWEDAAAVTEVFDHHMATLASTDPPQVLSTDSHTVKPWFQGKIPFSFNLPEGLPEDTILDGANFTYIHGQPGAQLLYHIGRHRVSVFLCARSDSPQAGVLPSERAGFRVISFRTVDLQGVAVSDVNPTRLTELLRAVEEVQTPKN